MGHRTSNSPSHLVAALVEALRRYTGILQEPLPRRFLIAQLLSSIGDWFNFVAVMLVANRLGVDNGELAVGTALAIRFVPRLIFQGPAGALSDRFRGPHLLILSQAGMGLLALSLVLLRWLPELWLLYSIIFLLEALYTVSRPAFMVLLIRIVPPPQRAAANGLIGIGLTAAQFVGAALGGLVSAWTTETTLFIINSLTFFVLALLIWQVRHSIPAQAEGAPLPEMTSDGVPALSSYRDLARQRDVMIYLAQQASIVILIQAATALFVTRALELGQPDSASGLLLSMVGLGLLAGSLLGGAGQYDTRRALRIVAVTEVASGLGLVIFGLTDVWTVALATLVLTGFASQISDVAGSTHFQNRLPEEIYGRFFSLFLLALSVGGLVGALLGPVLQQHLSTGRTLTVLFLPALLTSVALAWTSRSPVLAKPQTCHGRPG